MGRFEGSYDVVLGVDVGKAAHRACAVTADGRGAFNVAFGNDEADIDRVLGEATALGPAVLVVVDQRRNIGTAVVRRARAAGLEVAYMPGVAARNAARLFPGDAKTDERDAEVIARTALGVRGCLRAVPEEGALEGARRLEAQRAELVGDRTRQVNRLRAALLESCPAFERAARPGEAWFLAAIEELGGPWGIADAGRERLLEAAHGAPAGAAEALWDSLAGSTRPTEAQVAAERVTVPMIARRIREDSEDIAELARLVDEAARADEAYGCLLTVPGIGPRTAAQLVLDVAIEDFADHGHLASYCGLTPRNRRSGSSLDSVSSTLRGNRQLKNLLIFSCSCLARSSGYYRDYFDGCRARGMPYKAALKAVARKRMKVIYAVMRDRVPYDPALMPG